MLATSLEPVTTSGIPHPASSRLDPWPILAICLLSIFLFFFRLGDRDLASSHEARAGQDAQSMLNTGEWDLPRLFDGRVEMQKPPLFYWLVGLFGALHGGEVNAWCVRLPAALSALGCVLLLIAWGIRRGRPLAGCFAAIILATCVHFTDMARTGRIDMPLTLTVSLTLVGFSEGIQKRRQLGGQSGWQWLLLAFLATAAGILLKGPIAIALPLAVYIAWWAAQRLNSAVDIGHRTSNIGRVEDAGRRTPDTGRLNDIGHRTSDIGRLLDIGLSWGLPLVLALTVPWFLWANYRTDGEFFQVFFWHHNIDRGFGTEDHLRAYPWWFYGPRLAIDLLPWSLLLPVAAWSVWRRGAGAGDPEARFGAVWLLAMLVLLSAVRFKRADYLLPAYPGAAWMLGGTLESWYRAAPSRRFIAGFGAAGAVMVAFWICYLTAVIPGIELTRTHRRFAEEVRRQTTGPVLFFWAEAHLIGFHIGQPLTSTVEWSDLDALVGLPQANYVVMSVDSLKLWPQHLKQGTLEVVASSESMTPAPDQWPSWLQRLHTFGLDPRERNFVLVRTHCQPKATGNSYNKH